jgi:hypothetical protein
MKWPLHGTIASEVQWRVGPASAPAHARHATAAAAAAAAAAALPCRLWRSACKGAAQDPSEWGKGRKGGPGDGSRHAQHPGCKTS